MRFLPHRSSDAARSSPPDASPTGARPSDDALRHVCVDLLLERYAGWREECQTLDTAYRQWAVSSGSEREQAFAAYRAALDREEQAASAYGCVAARLVD